MIPTLALITICLIYATAAHAKKRPAEHGIWNPPRISQARETVVQRLNRGLVVARAALAPKDNA